MASKAHLKNVEDLITLVGMRDDIFRAIDDIEGQLQLSVASDNVAISEAAIAKIKAGVFALFTLADQRKLRARFAAKPKDDIAEWVQAVKEFVGEPHARDGPLRVIVNEIMAAMVVFKTATRTERYEIFHNLGELLAHREDGELAICQALALVSESEAVRQFILDLEDQCENPGDFDMRDDIVVFASAPSEPSPDPTCLSKQHSRA